MEQFLSSQERDNLKIQHRKERDKRICDRIKAVLLFNEGWDYQEIAHVLLLSDEAVKEHIREYQDSQKLRPENGGSYSKLTEDQTLNLSLVTLNIAEGAGEYSVSEKSRFYRMAKRSATECAGVLDICRRLQLIKEELYLRGRELLLRIVAMLIKLTKLAK